MRSSGALLAFALLVPAYAAACGGEHPGPSAPATAASAPKTR